MELLSESEHLDLLFFGYRDAGVDGIEAGKRFRKKSPMQDCHGNLSGGPDTGGLYLESLPVSAKTLREADVWEALEGLRRAGQGYRRISLWEMRQKVEVRQREIVYIQTYDSYTEYIVGNRLMSREIPSRPGKRA